MNYIDRFWFMFITLLWFAPYYGMHKVVISSINSCMHKVMVSYISVCLHKVMVYGISLYLHLRHAQYYGLLYNFKACIMYVNVCIGLANCLHNLCKESA